MITLVLHENWLKFVPMIFVIIEINSGYEIGRVISFSD